MGALFVPPAGEWSGGQIRGLRERVGMTQRELAQLLGVDRVTIARWEMGVRSTTHSRGTSVRRLLDCLDEHPEWLLEWTEEHNA